MVVNNHLEAAVKKGLFALALAMAALTDPLLPNDTIVVRQRMIE